MQTTRQDALMAMLGDIDPAKHAGESWYATEEYARPDDISSPYTRAEVGREDDYYPSPRDRIKGMYR